MLVQLENMQVIYETNLTCSLFGQIMQAYVLLIATQLICVLSTKTPNEMYLLDQ